MTILTATIYNKCLAATNAPLPVPTITNEYIKGDIKAFLEKIPGILGPIAIALFMFMLLYGGIKYMTAEGNTEREEEAKRTMIYAVIGLLICALSYVILRFVHKGIYGS